MRRSFVRLVVQSVLVCWGLTLAVVIVVSASADWSESLARQEGVFLVRHELSAVPPEERAARLRELQPNFMVDFELVDAAEALARSGRRLEPGEVHHHIVRPREHWYYLAFADPQVVLAAGPKDPLIPKGVVPVGFILAIALLPTIAALIAVRVDRELTKVESASKAIAVGDLGVRVDNPDGPSNELAANFNAMAERVERLVRNREELVQAVSHELGSPLSRLRFHVGLLEEELEQTGRVDAMTRELDALDELVAELLSYVQSDELELDRKAFDPKPGLIALAELVQLEALSHRSVEVSVQAPDGLEVRADPRLFQRAVENILRNARRHAHSQVEVEVVSRESGVCVLVHDDGPGIPEAHWEKVKTPFHRVEASRDRSTGGVGLGLAIVARIMDRHGGRMEIRRSRLGGAEVATVWP